MLRRRGMDELFKQKLLSLRRPQVPATFAQALFGTVDWASPTPAPKQAEKTNATQFTEKAQVIESLERFAQEKLATEGEKIIKIPGGEIALKPEPTWEGIPSYATFEELVSELSLDSKIIELCLKNKRPGQVRILFVSEAFRNFDELAAELKEGLINQLLPAFPAKTAELFSRMLLAMKLEEQEVVIYPTLFEDRDISNEVMKVAGHFKPEIIVTLGANATHKILKGQERLAQVHGQFFNRKIENIGTFVVVPLFHPSIIENNQNMKKTAWADMQKIMKYLKKL